MMLNISIPFVKQMIIMKAMLGRIHALMTTATFVALGTYTTLYSSIMTMINIVITVILLALGVSILAVIFIFPIGSLLAAPIIAFFVVIVIFIMPIIGMLADAMHGPDIAKPSPPP